MNYLMLLASQIRMFRMTSLLTFSAFLAFATTGWTQEVRVVNMIKSLEMTNDPYQKTELAQTYLDDLVNRLNTTRYSNIPSVSRYASTALANARYLNDYIQNDPVIKRVSDPQAMLENSALKARGLNPLSAKERAAPFNRRSRGLPESVIVLVSLFDPHQHSF